MIGGISMKKAILVVSFGTSYKETREKTIGAIEERIQKEFPRYKVYRAFTSKIILRKLEKEGLKIMNVEEALNQIKQDGIEELIVQPTHMINGIENDMMLALIEKRKGDFISVAVGNPLLHDPKDYKVLADAIGKENPVEKDEMLILMGHGSSHYSNSAYPALEYVFKDLGYHNTLIGTVEGYPAFEDVKRKMEWEKKQKAVLLPLMIVAGDHAANDMAGEEDSWKTQLEEAGYQVKCRLQGLGEMEEIQQIFVGHIKEALEEVEYGGN